MNQNIFLGVLIPFVGTTLGSAMVFFMRKEMNTNLQKALLGFASGVMIAASVWSLLLPAIDMSQEKGGIAWMPAAVGFLFGMAFLLLLDTITPHMHLTGDEEGVKTHLKKTTMLVLAVTLHNIPEGMAVGVTFAGVATGSSAISLAGAFALSMGIAIQNFPEGAIISMPLRSDGGMSKSRAFVYGTLSGIVEPIAAVITILLTSLVVPILPYLLSFASGAMIYVVVEELIPEAQAEPHTNISTIGVAIGFTLMMILDIALG